MGIRILVADENQSLKKELMTLLTCEGYEADWVSDGIAAIKHFRRYDYHIAVIDVGLPELDGRNVIRQLKKISPIPVVLMSFNQDEESILEGYALGAEDYIRKPFFPKELLARLKVITKRCVEHGSTAMRCLVFDGLHINTHSHTVLVDDKPAILTSKEYHLLVYLAQNPNRVLSREMLLNKIWGQDYQGTDRTVDTHIKTLREALRPYDPYISTIRGIGYSFDESCRGNRDKNLGQ